MDIRQLPKWALAAVAVITFQHAAGADTDVARIDNKAPAPARVDTPAYVAYLALATQFERAESEGNHAGNIAQVEKHLAVDPEQANRFVAFVLATWDEMNTTNHEIANRMLCSGKQPKYKADTAYAVLNVLHDIKDTNLRRTYRRVKVNFGADTSAQLDAWLAQINEANKAGEAQFQATYLDADRTVEQVISSACDMLAVY